MGCHQARRYSDRPTGTRKGSIIEGEVSWKWPGHPDGHGAWFALIMADAVHMAPEAAGKPMPIPSSLVGCEDGRACGAWILNGKTGTIPGQANLTVERFDDSINQLLQGSHTLLLKNDSD